MNYKITSVALREDQTRFINDSARDFKFSKFVRAKLDEYIKFKDELKNKDEMEDNDAKH